MKPFFKNLHQHILWRCLVGIMAIIGGITTLSSLYSDVIWPLFIEKNTAKEIELKELLLQFSDPNRLDWSTLAQEDSPIIWESDERYGEVPKVGFLCKFSCARQGETTILIDGKPTHQQFEKCFHPAIWTVSMHGCMADVECVQLVSWGSGYNEHPDIIRALSGHVELVKTHPDSAATFIKKLYKLTLPKRASCWLVESWSIGNHTWSCDFTIFPNPDSFALANECLNSF